MLVQSPKPEAPDKGDQFLQLNINALSRKAILVCGQFLETNQLFVSKKDYNHFEFLLLGNPSCQEVTF